MSDHRKREELEGLEMAESDALADVAERLRAARPQPAEAHFFDALQQRIAAQVAVTPLPQRRRTWTTRLAGLFPTWPRRLALVAAAAAAVAIAVLVLGSPDEPTPVRNLPTPEPIANFQPRPPVPEEPAPRPEDSAVGPRTAALEIPDELWTTGFLSHGALYAGDVAAEDVWAAGDDVPTADDELDADEAEWGGWALEDLTDAELLELEALLGG